MRALPTPDAACKSWVHCRRQYREPSFAAAEVSPCGQGKEVGLVNYSTTLTPPLWSDPSRSQLYIMVNNDPIDNLDDNGLIGHIAGGALVGCTAGATYSLITSWLGGDSACQCSCKAFGSCAVGAVFGAMGAAQPAWAGCLAGMSSNIINLGVSSVCDKACGKPQEQKGICVILNIMISGSVSCMAGPLASAPAGKMQAFAANFISNVIGFDVLSYCGLSN